MEKLLPKILWMLYINRFISNERWTKIQMY